MLAGTAYPAFLSSFYPEGYPVLLRSSFRMAAEGNPNCVIPPRCETSLRMPDKVAAQAQESNAYHQWPLRGLAFASDLGTVGHLVGLPKLFWAGWMLAAPYYALSVTSRADRKQKEEELIYQATANGLFPLLSAKLGVALGRMAEKRWNASQSKASTMEVHPEPWWRLGGGLAALAALTPTLCDPLSRWAVNCWHARYAGRNAQ